MNCDQVFLYLTSTRPHEWNGELDRHVAGCPTCRAMAELFRPAVALLGDRSAAGPAADAPRPWEQVWEAVSVAERAADQLRDRSSVRNARQPNRTASLIRSAALVIVGVLVGGLMGRVGAFGNQSSVVNRGVDPASQRLVGNVAGCRCENLVTLLRDSVATGSCPTCDQPTKTSARQLLALCTTCHRGPGDDRSQRVPSSRSWLAPRGLDDESRRSTGPISVVDPLRRMDSRSRDLVGDAPIPVLLDPSIRQFPSNLRVSANRDLACAAQAAREPSSRFGYCRDLVYAPIASRLVTS